MNPFVAVFASLVALAVAQLAGTYIILRLAGSRRKP